MNTGIVATRYAKALLAFAQEHAQGQAVYEAMKTLAYHYAHLPALRQSVGNKQFTEEQRCALLLQACITPPQNKAPDCLGRFFTLVLQQDRQELIQSMALQYVYLYRRSHGIVYGVLTTATAVDEDTVDRIAQLIKQDQGAVELEVRCDAALLGGFVLETDMKVLDASVATQLKKLRRSLAQ